MKVLIVDDDPLISKSLKVLLSHEVGIEVTGIALDSVHAIAACEKTLPDAVLMDIRMPGMNGIETTRRIKERWPQVRVMMLTTFHDNESVHASLSAGADGYLLKSTPPGGMAERLRALVSGASVVDVSVLKHLNEPSSVPLEGLTAREIEVAELVAQGCSNREIAEHLLISEGTTRNILSVILQKLDLRDRTQLAIRYWKRG
ncbi:MAG TPA: response regulator transcription factor [Spirochaetia bacterium]|nr:response regulator transcription factor [Spirochaetia bacterium]